MNTMKKVFVVDKPESPFWKELEENHLSPTIDIEDFWLCSSLEDKLWSMDENQDYLRDLADKYVGLIKDLIKHYCYENDDWCEFCINVLGTKRIVLNWLKCHSYESYWKSKLEKELTVLKFEIEFTRHTGMAKQLEMFYPTPAGEVSTYLPGNYLKEFASSMNAMKNLIRLEHTVGNCEDKKKSTYFSIG